MRGAADVPPRSSDGKTYLEPAEVADFEGAATNLRDLLLVRLLFHLGCRVSKALALQVQDVDFAGDAVTILHLKTRIRLAKWTKLRMAAFQIAPYDFV